MVYIPDLQRLAPSLHIELTRRYKMFLWVQESLPPKARTGGSLAPGVPHTTLDEAHLHIYHLDGMEIMNTTIKSHNSFNLKKYKKPK